MKKWSFDYQVSDFCEADTEEEAFRKIQEHFKRMGEIPLKDFMESDVSVWNEDYVPEEEPSCQEPTLNGEETAAFLKLFKKPAEKLQLKILNGVDPLSDNIKVKLRLNKKRED